MLRSISEPISEAYRLISIPVLAIIVLSLYFFSCQSTVAGYSGILGGVVWVIPNLYFMRRILGQTKVKIAAQLVRVIYRAEIIKLLLSAGLFILSVKLLPVKVTALLISFIVGQLVFWLVIWFYLGLKVR